MDYITEAITIGTAVVTITSAICALTPTPDPSTTWGKVYRAIEYAALIVGKAKQAGVVPANPKVDKVVDLFTKKD